MKMKMKDETHKVSFRFLFQFISLLVIATFLTGCVFNPSSDDPSDNILTEEDLSTPSTQINFHLHIPVVLSTDERIILEVLDEVTGLPYNTRQYDLEQSNDTDFSVSLPFPMGSVVKYRYVKIDTTFTPEAAINGEEVRYRLLTVTGNEDITDNLQSWLGEVQRVDTGELSGTLTDRSTGQPLADILVSIAGSLTFTDANGNFIIDGISPGVHNIVFYAIDGKYATFQQGATVIAGLVTPINVSLEPRPSIQVTFRVTGPNDALGIPIYMAGNIAQLGNTFSDLAGGMSIDPKRMPLLSQQEDGTFTLSLTLYAGTDLRYKFTLGDGYWNAEQKSTGDGFNVRQLIVPDHDVTLELSIASWRSPGLEPVTFNITVSPETNPSDEKFIQLKTRDWTYPIPLWPLGGGKYLFIVFSPLDLAVVLNYRFCRNEDCTNARNLSEDSIQPAESAQTVDLTLSDWKDWQPSALPTEVVAAFVPVKNQGYLTQIELSPEMSPSWRAYAPIGIASLPEMGTNSVLFTPQWFTSSSVGRISPELGRTPFKYELVDLLNISKSMGLSTGLFPQIGQTEDIATYWESTPHSFEWWQTWFASYRLFTLNYARIAADTGTDRLVIGGKALLPTFSGGMYPSGNPSDVPAELDQLWVQLIADIRAVYSGRLIWATNAQVSPDPLPSFINLFDGIYVSIDAPLAAKDTVTEEIIAANFTNVIDTQVYPIYQELALPLVIALGYPSVSNAVMGCILIDDSCTNDGLFLPREIESLPIDLNQQVQIYNAILPIAASRDWVAGISIRGYNPTVNVLGGSSSIAGKPARDVIWYWFSGLNPSIQ